MQINSLEARNSVSNMLNQLRNEIQRLGSFGAFSPEIAIKPERRSEQQWSQLLVNLGAQLQSITNPAMDDVTVYNTLVNGGVPEGFEILIKNDVLVKDDVYFNLYNLIYTFINTYGQMLQGLIAQAQTMSYGKRGKKRK